MKKLIASTAVLGLVAVLTACSNRGYTAPPSGTSQPAAPGSTYSAPAPRQVSPMPAPSYTPPPRTGGSSCGGCGG